MVSPIATLGLLSREPGLSEDTMSLEQRLVKAVAEESLSAQDKRTAIQQSISPNMATDPDKMLALQAKMADYSLEMALISTVTRKVIGAVETLVKS